MCLSTAGHGAKWNFDSTLIGNIVGDAWVADAVVGAVCHGPAGLLQAKRTDEEPIVKGLRVNCFTNAEKEPIGLN